MKGSKNASIGFQAPMAMPSGTPTIAASAKPPNTRQTVTPMSRAKPCTLSSRQPATAIVRGSARNVGLT